MSMSMEDAAAIVREAQRDMNAAGHALLQDIEMIVKVRAGMGKLMSGGFRPERVPSTLLLCSEIERIHREQMIRQAAVSEGLRLLL